MLKYTYVDSILPKAVLICSCCLVSACGGSESTTNVHLSDLAALNASADALLASFQPVTFSAPDLVPNSGRSEYAGYFLGLLADTGDNITDTLIGQMVVGVDFDATQMVSGEIYGILDENGNTMTGVIGLSGGTLDRAGDPNVDATFIFAGEGKLIDINANSIELDLVFEGDFLAANSTGIGGDILGRASSGETDQAVGGVFIMEMTESFVAGTSVHEK